MLSVRLLIDSTYRLHFEINACIDISRYTDRRDVQSTAGLENNRRVFPGEIGQSLGLGSLNLSSRTRWIWKIKRIILSEPSVLVCVQDKIYRDDSATKDVRKRKRTAREIKLKLGLQGRK